MTECCFQSSKSTNNNELSDFATMCSFIRSHPLYLSYLIFFSPYLLKLLSFLTPLFITTFLLVFSLLTTLIPFRSALNSQEGFFLTAYKTVLENLRPKFDDDEGESSENIEEFEVFKIVFEYDHPVNIEVMEKNPDEIERFEETQVGFPQENAAPQDQDHQCESVAETGERAKPSKVMEEVKKFESLLAKNTVPLPSNEGVKQRVVVSSKAEDEKKLPEALSQTVGTPPYLGSFGSMRKEREWRRTLACKLFEERHNWSNNGGNCGENGEEGMDMLWETPETESNRGKNSKEENKKGRSSRREKIEDLMMNIVKEDEDEFGGDLDDHHGKFCCLQALKLSAGKMNLNMGRPNLIKIGKAIKGMGWLQSPARRHGKKGYK